MISEHLEPKGLAPDAEPFSDGYAYERRRDAVRGSRKLKAAINRLQRPPKKRRETEFRPRTWVARLGARQQTRRIQVITAGYFGVRLSDLVGPDRRPEISRLRHIAMYLARTITTASYPDIALCFNRQDHTTVIYACDKIAGDDNSAEDVRVLHALLGVR